MTQSACVPACGSVVARVKRKGLPYFKMNYCDLRIHDIHVYTCFTYSSVSQLF